MDTIVTIGRRKASVARIFLRKGSGAILVNGRDYKEYFPLPHIQYSIENPIKLVGLGKEYDIKVNVSGGGFKGQAEAITLGLARAFVQLDEENRKVLKQNKYLTRDARVVERKKYGKPKARKSFQFSKR